MNLIFDQKLACIFNLIVVVPTLIIIGYKKLSMEEQTFSKFIIGLAIVIGVYNLINLYRLMDWGKPFKLLEGYTDKMTSCEKVHHIKMFDSMPGYSHPVMNIRVGDCVFWTNIGEQQHTVTSTKEITYNVDDKPALISQNGLTRPDYTLNPSSTNDDLLFGLQATATSMQKMAYFNKSKGSLVIGQNTYANISSVGNNSLVVGFNGFNSGSQNIISGNLSTIISANNSINVGNSNTIVAPGAGACAVFGEGNGVNGFFAFACGKDNIATGPSTFVCGSNNVAENESSVAMGSLATTNHNYSFVFGTLH